MQKKMRAKHIEDDYRRRKPESKTQVIEDIRKKYGFIGEVDIADRVWRSLQTPVKRNTSVKTFLTMDDVWS